MLFDINLEGLTLSYNLVFHPCPVWFQSSEKIGVPNRKNPSYNIRHLEYLLKKVNFNFEDLNSPRVEIVCHENGLGRAEDLDLLISDLK